MPDLSDDIRAAWRTAAQDLGFTWTERYSWLTPDSRRMEYLGLVHGFGRAKGTLVRIMQLGEFPGITTLDDDFLIAKIGNRFAYYDRALWEEELRKWGYHPEADPKFRPHWMAAGSA